MAVSEELRVAGDELEEWGEGDKRNEDEMSECPCHELLTRARRTSHDPSYGCSCGNGPKGAKERNEEWWGVCVSLNEKGGKCSKRLSRKRNEIFIFIHFDSRYTFIYFNFRILLFLVSFIYFPFF